MALSEGGSEEHEICTGEVGCYDRRLVDYLRTVSFFDKRTATLVQNLASRAKGWQLKHRVSDSCMANMGPESIAMAFRISEPQRRALQGLSRDSYDASIHHLGKVELRVGPEKVQLMRDVIARRALGAPGAKSVWDWIYPRGHRVVPGGG